MENEQDKRRDHVNVRRYHAEFIKNRAIEPYIKILVIDVRLLLLAREDLCLNF